MIEGYRRMSPAQKLERVAPLNRALVTLQTALRLDPEIMRTVLG